ncbi:MAG: flagellar biosynthesis protein FliQ [Actinomycetota bacterium]|nr:Flagellar biosynthesis protein FliQ [Glaciihabitans sp.]MDQ1544489.1 flagellar biosynthesis protein FliQ [Actinomycetota bacterium]MDQ1565078.1 flagellar biosynthesis protein FliQ [Actinomycetota bacterium]MDQ1573038.1 flagellar biosynthesis protein FliQ [Actinomycetota bacterium]
MDSADVIDIGTQALTVAAELAAPVLITALVVGFAISVFQSITQIQETSLSFVPKVVAVSLALLICGQWMISDIVTFTLNLFHQIPHLVGG